MPVPIPVIDGILNIGGKLIDRWFPDPAKADAARLELFKLQQSGELQQMAGQLAINQEEAKNGSLFVAGWRPWIGWVCGMGCAWNWIGLPIAKLLLALAGQPIELEMADLSEMFPLLLGMLGMSGLRTAEKIKGVAAK